MGYRLNEDSSILYNGNIAVLKAANDVGKTLLAEILKQNNFSSVGFNVLPLTYLPDQKTWLDTKGRYVLFDLSENQNGVELVTLYQKRFNDEAEPTVSAQVVDFSGGALATDGGLVLADTANEVIDIPKDSDVKSQKITQTIENKDKNNT